MPDDGRLIDLPLGNENHTRAAFRGLIEEINTKAAGALQGTLAARPAATAMLERFLYKATDTDAYFWCDGVGWAEIGGGAPLADSAPPAIADAGAVGVSEDGAREDHTHAAHTQMLRKDTLTNKGDIYVATAGGVVTRLAVGAEGRIPVSRAAQATGIAWEVPTPALADSAPPAIADAGAIGASADAAREDHTHAAHAGMLNRLGMMTVARLERLLQRVDTRRINRTYNGDGTVNVETHRNAANDTTLKTVTYTYNGDGTVATRVEVVDGLTITTTYTYVAEQITVETRAVA